jgi:hypothetical protein
MNELGLLSVACLSADPAVQGSWPLEFDLRPHRYGTKQHDDDETLGAGVESDRLDRARTRITTIFSRPLDIRDKLSATNLLRSLEQVLGKPKAEWNYVLIRSLWQPLNECYTQRNESIEHEETWLILAGYFLRPGFGAKGDNVRINDLWRIHLDGLAYRGKRNQLQQYILWRRVSGGLSHERQQNVLEPELSRLRKQTTVPAELVRLAGSLERIDLDFKAELVDRFLQIAREHATSNRHCASYLAALGLLLNRSPLYAGPEFVMPAVHVETAFDALSGLDWADSNLVEIQTLFLRAARIVDDPKIDLPKSLRDKIASKLQRTGVAPARIARLRSYVPLASDDRANLFGESLPPGLVIGS